MIFPDEGSCVVETLELLSFQIVARVDDLGLMDIPSHKELVQYANIHSIIRHFQVQLIAELYIGRFQCLQKYP